MFHILLLNNTPILTQLRIEEALLRADDKNWCIINSGSSEAIVLGISGKPEELIDLKHLATKPVPLIKRFSGGGTVFVDPNTIFVTFICNEDFVKIPSYPQSIMKWTSDIYRSLLVGKDFSLCENDYVLGSLKFGGNAQYIRKNRWLHHSSLLWDFNPKNMKYLKMPSRMPKYREKREHNDFLCSLREIFPDQSLLKDQLLKELAQRFTITQASPKTIDEILARPHRKGTKELQLPHR